MAHQAHTNVWHRARQDSCSPQPSPWKGEGEGCHERPDLPAVRSRPDPARPAGDPLVRAGLYRQPAAGLARHAAPGGPHARGGDRRADRRLPDLGHAWRRAGRAAGLRAVLPAQPVPGASAGHLRRVGRRHELPWRLPGRGGRLGAVLPPQRHSPAGLRRPAGGSGADRAGAGPGGELHQRRAVGPRRAGMAALGDGVPPRRRFPPPSQPALPGAAGRPGPVPGAVAAGPPGIHTRALRRADRRIPGRLRRGPLHRRAIPPARRVPGLPVCRRYDGAVALGSPWCWPDSG